MRCDQQGIRTGLQRQLQDASRQAALVGASVYEAPTKARIAFHTEVLFGLGEDCACRHLLPAAELRFSAGGVRIDHLNGIVVNHNARVGEDARIYQQVTIGDDFEHGPGESPVIGDHVRIGAGAKIIGNIRVGNNVTIGANAVVTRDVPDGATVVGANKILI